MERFKLMLCALVVSTSFRSNIYAVGSGGIASEVPSAESLGSLLGVTGSKTDPATVYNNPAAIGDQGTFNGTIGLSNFNISGERSGSNGSDKMKSQNVLVPNAHAVMQLGEKWGVGLSILSPYGLETEWAADSNVRYTATKSKLNMIDVTPAVSYRPNNKWAFGFGADYYSTFDADLQNKVPVNIVNYALTNQTDPSQLVAGNPDGNAKLSGDGDQWGYHTGILFNPSEHHTFGFTYHSEVKTRIEGELEVTGLAGLSASVAAFNSTTYKSNIHTDLFYPQNVQLGYKFTQGDKWEAGFNLAWYDWSENKQLEIVLQDKSTLGQTAQALFGQPIPLHWRDVWSGTIGGFYRFSDTWKLNMGAYYLPAVYPEETYSPRVPDMDKIGVSVGPAFTKGAWSLDTVYNPIFYRKTTINNQIGSNVGQNISGEYDAMVHIVGINVKYRYQ